MMTVVLQFNTMFRITDLYRCKVDWVRTQYMWYDNDTDTTDRQTLAVQLTMNY